MRQEMPLPCEQRATHMVGHAASRRGRAIPSLSTLPSPKLVTPESHVSTVVAAKACRLFIVQHIKNTAHRTRPRI